MNPTYRSVFSGLEIDEAIASMKNSTNGVVISNDFFGGVTKAASAELAKTLNDNVEQIKDPTFLASLLETIPGYESFNAGDREKLDSILNDFRGAYLDNASRDTANAPYSLSYDGNEIAIVLDNGDGVSEVSRWNTGTNSWVPVSFNGTFPKTLVPIASTVSTLHFNKNKNVSMKCFVTVSNVAGTQRHIQEVIIAIIGGDTFISVYGDLGNAELFVASSSISGDQVRLDITTLAPNLTIHAKQIIVV